jgi:hypothetical protein
MATTLVEVHRPRWSTYADPRLETLADAFTLLSAATADPAVQLEAAG